MRPQWDDKRGNPALPELPAMREGLRVDLTDDHALRQRALAVPDAFWDKPTGQYCIINPSPRAARAAIALFPDVLNRHPDLADVSNRGLENVRPTDYASQVGIRLEVGKLGDSVELYGWQDIDAGYMHAILERDGGANVLWSRGLGKTTVSAAFIKKLEAQRTLVVCRNDAKAPVWRAQLGELLPDHHVVVLPNVKAKRERVIQAWSDPKYRTPGAGTLGDILVIHYEALALIAGDQGRGKGWDKLGDWDLMIFDEGHRLASMNPNSPSKNTQMGKGTMKARKRAKLSVNLTGSAIMNHPEDLFGQLHYLFPDRYKAKWRDYNDRFLDYVDIGGGRQFCIGFKEEALPQLRDELGVFTVFRTKDEVLELPPPDPREIVLDLEPAQRKAYEDMRDQFWADVEGSKALMAGSVLAQLNHLRQIATWTEGLPSAKLRFALSEIEEEPDEQFVVFTWFKAPGRALAEMLGDQAVVVDGDVPAAQRAVALERHKRGDARVLVGSIATLGESLNLQYCHEAIRLDRAWNPATNDQTFDRLYRNGQNRTVTFRDLVARDTVDELRVKPILTSKDSLRKAVFGG